MESALLTVLERDYSQCPLDKPASQAASFTGSKRHRHAETDRRSPRRTFRALGFRYRGAQERFRVLCAIHGIAIMHVSYRCNCSSLLRSNRRSVSAGVSTGCPPAYPGIMVACLFWTSTATTPLKSSARTPLLSRANRVVSSENLYCQMFVFQRCLALSNGK